MIQADMHLVKSRLIGHTQQARDWANNPNRCTDPVCAAVIEAHCKHLDGVATMLEEIERLVTGPHVYSADQQLMFDELKLRRKAEFAMNQRNARRDKIDQHIIAIRIVACDLAIALS